jgi:glycosyltransferase involved in cell wall biosynthesis
VPGNPQQLFAKKLGFKDDQILCGFYSADVDHFKGLYGNAISAKTKEFPHRFLYMGRYVDFKGVKELWDAFIEANSSLPESKKWELWCVGTGDLWEERRLDDHIKHFGFMQPKELEAIIKNTGVFVLPSHKEPWGVVVHEMAVAGFPLLCSDKVGATSTFLEEGKNGFYFKNNSKEALREALTKVMTLADNDLLKMGNESHAIGLKLNPKEWAETVLSVVEE